MVVLKTREMIALLTSKLLFMILTRVKLPLVRFILTITGRGRQSVVAWHLDHTQCLMEGVNFFSLSVQKF